MSSEEQLQRYLKHRVWIECLLWVVLRLGSAAANTVTVKMDFVRQGRDTAWWEVASWEFSSAIVWLLLLPLIVRALDAKPLQWGTFRRNLPWHLLFSLLCSGAHVLGMVGIRKVVYAVQGSSYDFGVVPRELMYEAIKDVRSYALVLFVVAAYRLLLWRWQGEASVLAPAPEAAPADVMPEPARPERLLVKKLGKEFLLPMDEIEWVQACGNYVNLRRQQHDYPLRSSLAAFEQRLDPAQFVRVHRSYLVRLSLIASIEPTEAGDATLRLRDGSQLPCSRTHLDCLRQQLT